MRRIPYTTNSRQVYIQHSRLNERALDKAIRYINNKCDAYDIISVYNPFFKDDIIDVEVNQSMSMLKRVVLMNILDSFLNVDDIVLYIDMLNGNVEEDDVSHNMFKTIKIEDKLFSVI